MEKSEMEMRRADKEKAVDTGLVKCHPRVVTHWSPPK